MSCFYYWEKVEGLREGGGGCHTNFDPLQFFEVGKLKASLDYVRNKKFNPKNMWK
jgi:hypothetical protein